MKASGDARPHHAVGRGELAFGTGSEGCAQAAAAEQRIHQTNGTPHKQRCLIRSLVVSRSLLILLGAEMTLPKRTQGRPPRSSGINGRDKLIEATRLYLRSNRKMSLTRTEIAQGCGVTPALISYYFKDKRSLLEAVTKPLIKTYRQQLSFITSSDHAPAEKMRRIIKLLIELNTENAFLVDYMLRDIASPHMVEAEDQAVIDVFHTAIAALAGELVAAGLWRGSDLVMAEVALWGMCRAFGEALRVKASASPPEVLALVLEAKVDFVYRSFAPHAACASSP